MSDAVETYLAAVSRLISGLAGDGKTALLEAASACARAALADRVIWLFGAGHGQCLALELHHRAGVPACFVPMASPALTFAEGAAVETALERQPAMALAMIERFAWCPGDVLIAISSSGTTPLTVEIARVAKQRGLTLVVLGSVASSDRQPDRTSLFDFADYRLDTGVPNGDAVVDLTPDLRVGALSGVAGTLLVQLLAVRVAELLLEHGVPPPVWRASALAGADAHNDRLAAVWRARNPSL